MKKAALGISKHNAFRVHKLICRGYAAETALAELGFDVSVEKLQVALEYFRAMSRAKCQQHRLQRQRQDKDACGDMRSPGFSRAGGPAMAQILMTERDARIIEMPTSITAVFCGDPPPSRAALAAYAGWKPYEAVATVSRF